MFSFFRRKKEKAPVVDNEKVTLVLNKKVYALRLTAYFEKFALQSEKFDFIEGGPSLYQAASNEYFKDLALTNRRNLKTVTQKKFAELVSSGDWYDEDKVNEFIKMVKDDCVVLGYRELVKPLQSISLYNSIINETKISSLQPNSYELGYIEKLGFITTDNIHNTFRKTINDIVANYYKFVENEYTKVIKLNAQQAERFRTSLLLGPVLDPSDYSDIYIEDPRKALFSKNFQLSQLPSSFTKHNFDLFYLAFKRIVNYKPDQDVTTIYDNEESNIIIKNMNDVPEVKAFFKVYEYYRDIYKNLINSRAVQGKNYDNTELMTKPLDMALLHYIKNLIFRSVKYYEERANYLSKNQILSQLNNLFYVKSIKTSFDKYISPLVSELLHSVYTSKLVQHFERLKDQDKALMFAFGDIHGTTFQTAPQALKDDLRELLADALQYKQIETMRNGIDSYIRMFRQETIYPLERYLYLATDNYLYLFNQNIIDLLYYSYYIEAKLKEVYERRLFYKKDLALINQLDPQGVRPGMTAIALLPPEAFDINFFKPNELELPIKAFKSPLKILRSVIDKYKSAIEPSPDQNSNVTYQVKLLSDIYQQTQNNYFDSAENFVARLNNSYANHMFTHSSLYAYVYSQLRQGYYPNLVNDPFSIERLDVSDMAAIWQTIVVRHTSTIEDMKINALLYFAKELTLDNRLQNDNQDQALTEQELEERLEGLREVLDEQYVDKIKELMTSNVVPMFKQYNLNRYLASLIVPGLDGRLLYPLAGKDDGVSLFKRHYNTKTIRDYLIKNIGRNSDDKGFRESIEQLKKDVGGDDNLETAFEHLFELVLEKYPNFNTDENTKNIKGMVKHFLTNKFQLGDQFGLSKKDIELFRPTLEKVSTFLDNDVLDYTHYEILYWTVGTKIQEQKRLLGFMFENENMNVESIMNLLRHGRIRGASVELADRTVLAAAYEFGGLNVPRFFMASGIVTFATYLANKGYTKEQVEGILNGSSDIPLDAGISREYLEQEGIPAEFLTAENLPYVMNAIAFYQQLRQYQLVKIKKRRDEELAIEGEEEMDKSTGNELDNVYFGSVAQMFNLYNKDGSMTQFTDEEIQDLTMYVYKNFRPLDMIPGLEMDKAIDITALEKLYKEGKNIVQFTSRSFIEATGYSPLEGDIDNDKFIDYQELYNFLLEPSRHLRSEINQYQQQLQLGDAESVEEIIETREQVVGDKVSSMIMQFDFNEMQVAAAKRVLLDRYMELEGYMDVDKSIVDEEGSVVEFSMLNNTLDNISRAEDINENFIQKASPEQRYRFIDNQETMQKIKAYRKVPTMFDEAPYQAGQNALRFLRPELRQRQDFAEEQNQSLAESVARMSTDFRQRFEQAIYQTQSNIQDVDSFNIDPINHLLAQYEGQVMSCKMCQDHLNSLLDSVELVNNNLTFLQSANPDTRLANADLRNQLYHIQLNYRKLKTSMESYFDSWKRSFPNDQDAIDRIEKTNFLFYQKIGSYILKFEEYTWLLSYFEALEQEFEAFGLSNYLSISELKKQNILDIKKPDHYLNPSSVAARYFVDSMTSFDIGYADTDVEVMDVSFMHDSAVNYVFEHIQDFGKSDQLTDIVQMTNYTTFNSSLETLDSVNFVYKNPIMLLKTSPEEVKQLYEYTGLPVINEYLQLINESIVEGTGMSKPDLSQTFPELFPNEINESCEQRRDDMIKWRAYKMKDFSDYVKQGDQAVRGQLKQLLIENQNAKLLKDAMRDMGYVISRTQSDKNMQQFAVTIAKQREDNVLYLILDQIHPDPRDSEHIKAYKSQIGATVMQIYKNKAYLPRTEEYAKSSIEEIIDSPFIVDSMNRLKGLVSPESTSEQVQQVANIDKFVTDFKNSVRDIVKLNQMQSVVAEQYRQVKIKIEQLKSEIRHKVRPAADRLVLEDNDLTNDSPWSLTNFAIIASMVAFFGSMDYYLQMRKTYQTQRMLTRQQVANARDILMRIPTREEVYQRYQLTYYLTQQVEEYRRYQQQVKEVYEKLSIVCYLIGTGISAILPLAPVRKFYNDFTHGTDPREQRENIQAEARVAQQRVNANLALNTYRERMQEQGSFIADARRNEVVARDFAEQQVKYNNSLVGYMYGIGYSYYSKYNNGLTNISNYIFGYEDYFKSKVLLDQEIAEETDPNEISKKQRLKYNIDVKKLQQYSAHYQKQIDATRLLTDVLRTASFVAPGLSQMQVFDKVVQFVNSNQTIPVSGGGLASNIMQAGMVLQQSNIAYSIRDNLRTIITEQMMQGRGNSELANSIKNYVQSVKTNQGNAYIEDDLMDYQQMRKNAKDLYKLGERDLGAAPRFPKPKRMSKRAAKASQKQAKSRKNLAKYLEIKAKLFNYRASKARKQGRMSKIYAKTGSQLFSGDQLQRRNIDGLSRLRIVRRKRQHVASRGLVPKDTVRAGMKRLSARLTYVLSKRFAS